MGTSLNTGHNKTARRVLVGMILSLLTVNAMATSVLITETVTTNTYDDYGNPTSVTVTVTGEDTVGNLETYTTYTENTYTNDTANWYLGRLTQAKVTQYLPSNTDTKDGTCTVASPSTCDTRESSFEYEIGVGTDNTGLLTKEIIEPNNAALTLTTEYDYDAFGNKTSVTVTGGSGTSAIAARTTTTTYDTRGQFAISTTNALGHSETRAYDAKYGVMTSLTGPNNLTTTWAYDSFGRQVSETRADGTMTTITREWCDGYQGETGHTNCPSGGVLVQTTETDGVPITSQFSDVLGRVIQTETEGFDGTLILVDTQYDALGRIQTKSRPYFLGTLANDIEWHSFTYDVVGRLLTETAPDGGVTTSIYAGLQTTIKNAMNQMNVRMKNARGEVVYVIDPNLRMTNYDYDAFGNLITVTDAASNVTTNAYDIRGRKISMDDLDMGYWTYDYNALGELISQTDAIDNAGGAGPTVTMTYDLLGRMLTRVETEGTSTWLYDYDPNANPAQTYADGQAAHSIGKLINVIGVEGKTEAYTYDSLGRAASTTTTIDSVNYITSQTYDLEGRVDTITYPASTHHLTGFQVSHVYNTYGYLEKITDGITDYWTANSQNAEGQLTQMTYGNSVSTQHAYDVQTGRITDIGTSTALGTNDVQNLGYTFDNIGNLTQRVDYNQTSGGADLTESFVYDVLNRMTSSEVDDGTTITTKTTTYDDLGNILTKSDIGSYTYGATAGSLNAGPHAVTTVIDNNSNTRDFVYDLNGNQTTGYNFTTDSVRTQTWTSYNKVKTIVQDTTTLTFSYGADRARFKQVNNNGKTTTYIGGLYEKEDDNGLITHVHYIKAGSTTVAQYKSKSNNTEELRYLHRDHIGSVTAITDEAGVIVETLSYDPWGKRRDTTWADAIAQLSSFETTRGFTNHEMLDDVGLIHMNGRVYDPSLGRFISADPFVQEPLNGQSLNRYSYVLNNPLSFTDPSGYFFSSIFKAIKSVVKAVVGAVKSVVKAVAKSPIGRAIATIGAGVACGPAAAACAAAASATFTAANGGGLIDILTSAATAYHASGGEQIFGNISNQDILNGLKIASAFGRNSRDTAKESIQKTAAAARSAALGAAKFVNGAVSSAFNYVQGLGESNAGRFALELVPGVSLALAITHGEGGFAVALGVLDLIPGGGKLVSTGIKAGRSILPSFISKGVRANVAKSTVQANKAAGDAFEQQVKAQLQKTQTGVVDQVTIKTQSGVRTRIDLLGRDASGAIKCTECKASATAPLTKNQKLGFPEIQQSGGVVVGKGKPGFPGGTQIPPTKVDIIRP